ncbi:MAG: TIGR02253 family HAD-type hydrolase [Candidatus Micrarchaeota archaeon]
MKIEAIFFDLDNTLYPTTEFAERARRNAINAMRESGLNVSEQKAYNTLLNVIKKHSSNYDYHFDEMLKEIGADYSPRIIAAGIVAYHNTKASILPFPEAKTTILKLRDIGYRLYIASEGNTLKQWDKVIRLGLHLMFHNMFVTQEFGRNKSKEFYASILKKLKLRPQQCIMVGDSQGKDIRPAKQAGMHTVIISKTRQRGPADYAIRNTGELLRVLEKLEG